MVIIVLDGISAFENDTKSISGITPTALSGSNTGVFAATGTFAEFLPAIINDPTNINGFELMINQRTMTANRISYCFNFKGKYKRNN